MKVGINLSSNVDWQTGRYWLDLKNVLRPWGSPAKPYEPAAFPLSPDGYPLQDFGGFAELHNYPGGLYAYSYSGSGVLTWLQGVAVSANSGRAGTVVVTVRNSGSPDHSKSRGSNPADPFHNLTIRRTAPGIFDFRPGFPEEPRPRSPSCASWTGSTRITRLSGSGRTGPLLATPADRVAGHPGQGGRL
jgi:hypothetical protein